MPVCEIDKTLKIYILCRDHARNNYSLNCECIVHEWAWLFYQCLRMCF